MAASTAPADKIQSNFQIQSFDHDPGATTAQQVSADGGTNGKVQDMRDVSSFMVLATPTVIGANGLTLLEIIAAAAKDANDMLTTPVVVRAHAATVNDALGDYTILEISDQDLQELSTVDVRYASARLTMATATDEAVVIFIAKFKRPRLALTASVQA